MNNVIEKLIYTKPTLTDLSAAQTETGKDYVRMGEGIFIMGPMIGETRGTAS